MLPTARKQPRKATIRKRRSNLDSLPASIRPDHLAHLNEALHWLFRELNDAAELHRNGDFGGRAGAVRAAKAVTAFLMLFRTVNKKGLVVPLAQVADGLTALDQNTVKPMMRPIPRSGRARASEGRQSLKGIAVYIVRRLQDQDIGKDRHTALKMVAAKLAACDVRPDRGAGKITARTVRNWDDQVSADVGRHGSARQTFDGLLAEKERLPAHKLLNRLAYVVRQTRAHERA
jgi:hypothetical protein